MGQGSGSVPDVKHLPTLTDEVQLSTPTPEPASPQAPGADVHVDTDRIVERVLEDLRRELDVHLESRLREALTRVLARLGDSLIREVRAELDAGLHEAVERAVAGEIARQRAR